jgi:two-component system sensor histidine kinase DegS
MDNQIINQKSTADDFYELLNKKITSVNESLKRVNSTIEQSQNEISRLTQKASLVTAQLQKCQSNLDQVSKEEINDRYTEAMDSQQRLLVMRSQLDRLQEQLHQLNALHTNLEELKDAYSSDSRENAFRMSQSRRIETLEMLLTAQETERQRLSRQMHDGPAQALSNFIVQAEIATKLFDIDPVKARDELEKLKTSAMSTFQKIRNFVAEIRPMMLDDLGLVPTLKKHITSVKEDKSIDVSLTINGGEKSLEPYLEVFLFRSVQELVDNAINRNQNNTDLRISVVLTLDNSRVILSVMDNGKEFSAEELKAEDGLGVNLIEERVNLLGGKFDIQTTNVASVEITMSIPVLEIPVN